MKRKITEINPPHILFKRVLYEGTLLIRLAFLLWIIMSCAGIVFLIKCLFNGIDKYSFRLVFLLVLIISGAVYLFIDAALDAKELKQYMDQCKKDN